MKNHRYILEPYKGIKTRHTCPNCLKLREFTRYIDIETNEYVNNDVGKCNRIDKCDYHYSPSEYFLKNDFINDESEQKEIESKSELKPISCLKPSFINLEIMNKSLKSTRPNYFVDYLKNKFDIKNVTKVINKYKIGTSKKWNGSTIFWQIDINGKIRTGKIMLYNASSCKRVKKPHNHITWVHKLLKLNDFSLKQCLFGEHLLINDCNKPVAIVESEKTAIISSIYFPEFIWLASGGVSNLNQENTKVLSGRNVVLFPDLNSFDKWKDKIPTLNPLVNFEISEMLENMASKLEKEQGFDIADYLLS